MPRPPAWYRNLRAHPLARVEAEGRTLAVRADELSDAEAAETWPRVLAIAPDYRRYRERTDRPLRLLRLVQLTDVDPATVP
jgi:deazaflavin-dependent oxidoreductase (nitroreductase family)